MKFNPTRFSENPGRSILFAAMLYVAVCLSSCKNDDTVNVPNQAAFTVANASPTKASLDFYLDNQKVNTSGPLLFGDNTGYWIAASGSRTGKVTVSGNTTSLHTQKIDLENDRYHSIFIINSGDTLSLLKIRDEWSVNLPQGKAQIRFINLSPDSPTYNLEYAGDTTTFNNRAYKDFTPFKTVTAKTGISLNLRNAGTNAVVATLSNIELKSNYVYTIWAKGLVNTAVDSEKVTLKVTEHIERFRTGAY